MRAPGPILLLGAAVLLGGGSRGTCEEAGPAAIRAANDYGVQLLRSGNAEEALRVLRPYEGIVLDSEALAFPDRAAYLYNLGKASEELPEVEQALRDYSRAVALCPSFRPALTETLRLAEVADPRVGLRTLVGLVEGLLRRADLGTTEELLRAILANSLWWRSDSEGLLARAVTGYLTAAATGPAEFREQWLAVLQDPESGVRPGWVELVAAAYGDDLPEVLSTGDASQFFRDWRTAFGTVSALPSFLKMVGDGLFRAGEERLALQRYSLAWSLRNDRLDLALSLLNVVANGSEDVDPEGYAYRAVSAYVRSSPTSAPAGPEGRQALAGTQRLLEKLSAQQSSRARLTKNHP